MSISRTIYICSLITVTICVAENVRYPPDTIDFFPEIKGNLTKLTWAHAVNNASFLENVLSDLSIMMIEADIVLGTLKGDNSGAVMPIMGHPPATTSDISLVQFLETINQANNNSNTTDGSVKGVKLDFKSIDVFERSLKILDDQYDKARYPFWINADILPGPLDSQVVPVDSEKFLNATIEYDHAVLSIGWTTRYGGTITEASYSEDQIADMVSVLEKSGSLSPVTFPVRAGIAANSQSQMLKLLRETNSRNSTLTVWSSVGDFVNIEKLRNLIYSCGLDRVFLDVPPEVSDILNL